jgi:predicted nucleic acid-binding Zn ribbon protein
MPINNPKSAYPVAPECCRRLVKEEQKEEREGMAAMVFIFLAFCVLTLWLGWEIVYPWCQWWSRA